MALKLAAPIEKECKLEETDKHFETEGTTILILQASQKEHEKRSSMFSEIIRRVERDEEGNQSISFVERFCVPELMRVEARLTIVESNIEDEKGKPLFKKNMSHTAFDRAWGKLPPLVAYEIHSKILEVNPDWVPLGE